MLKPSLACAALLAAPLCVAGVDPADVAASAIDAASLRAFHTMLADEPHVAGTPGDARVVDKIARAFEAAGLRVERQELRIPLPRLERAEVELIVDGPGGPRRETLSLQERPVDADPDTADARLGPGWNAWSGSGVAVGRVVYANYGRKEDFERLAELGVDARGAIVIARYGGNYRGYKAVFAERAGAAGLLIYTDPVDAGYARGLMWPEGGFANETLIQRGSILALDYPGDPFTPYFASTPTPERPPLPRDEVPLCTIPVQPIGWAEAEKILGAMTGEPVPAGAPGSPNSWQGGLPLTYRLTGGDGLRVRVRVEQPLETITTWNVLGTLEGREAPDEFVVIGCHHDAWAFGAQDPASGTMLVLEAARVLGELAETGWRPRRSIVFAGWGAEEFGIIGSTEWVEANADRLRNHCVAYINLDAATFGLMFGGSAAPALKPLIAEIVGEVYADPDAAGPQAPGEPPAGADVARRPPMRLGDMGGGSDHVGFWSHLAVPSCGLGAGGARGNAYHSNYDTLRWWRSVVGDDYHPAALLAEVTTRLALRLADSPVLPYDVAQPLVDFEWAVAAIEERAKAVGAGFDGAALRARATELRRHAEGIAAQLDGEPSSSPELNGALRELQHVWFEPEGLPDRPWHRNLFASPDETSGYSPWVLPGLRRAVERKDDAAIGEASSRLLRALGDYERGLEAVESAVEALRSGRQ